MRQGTLTLVIPLAAMLAYACGGGGGGGGSPPADTTPPAVTANLAAGSYAGAQTVTLTADGPANIYYTLDGSEPTTASAVYSSPIAIAETATLRFLAVDPAGNRSGVVAVAYTIADPLLLTRENAFAAAEGAVRATSALNELSFLRRQVLNGVVAAPPGRLAARAGPSLARLLARGASLTAEQTLSCDAGSATIRSQAAQPQNRLAPGDTGSITYSSCVLGPTTLGGSVSFAVARNQSFPALPFELEIAYTIDQLRATQGDASKIIHGSFTMVARSADGQTFETWVAGGPVTWDESTTGQRTLTTLADFSARTTQLGATGAYAVEIDRATLMVSGAAVERTITFSTTAALRGTGEAPPQEGELLVAGEASNLRIVQRQAGPTVELWIDLQGDGLWDGAPTQTTWTELGW